MEFGKRLKEARMHKKLTQEALANKVNTKKQTISNYETGYSTPSHEMLVDLSDALEVTTDWLLGKVNTPIGEAYDHYLRAKELRDYFTPDLIAEMYYESKKEKINVKKQSYPEKENEEFIDIPVLGTIYAGTPLDRIEQHEGTYPVLKRTINGYDAFWLKVKGESMSGDEIHNGDLVCVIKTTEVHPSDISAVAVNGDEATLKRVKFLDGQCILTPSNRNMEPMIYQAKDIHIIGKVVGFQRYYK